MKLLRVCAVGAERPAVLADEGHYFDASDVISEFDKAFFGSGGFDRLSAALPDMQRDRKPIALAGTRLVAPIARPHQILCIGLNYCDHAEETGQAIPDEPILFTKAPNTLVDPNDDVPISRGSVKTDYEVKLGVVIGRRAHYLPDVAAATEHIAGYVLVNDVSEQGFQMERGGQWTKGKSCAAFNPCGPYMVIPDEVIDPQNLEMWLDVNGDRRQSGTTATMLFHVGFLVHYLSQFMILEPGDLLNTGMPLGVGIGLTPLQYLRDGDVVELGIAGLGAQRQRMVSTTRAQS